MRLPDLTTETLVLRARPDGWDIAVGDRVVGRVLTVPAAAATRIAVEVHESARDRGVGTAALRASAAWLLCDGGVRRLEHRASFGCWAGLRVAEKAGFAYEGLLRGATEDRQDVWLSARLASDDGAERATLLPQPWLHGGAVTLRPYEDGDVADLTAGAGDALTQRWIATMPSPYTEADAVFWIRHRSVEHRPSGGEVNFAIVENTSGRLVGGIGLHHLDHERRQGEVGYWLAPWGRGKGYAAEATRVIARWALSALGLQRISLLAAVGNAASQRVAERAGFERVGLVRAGLVARDGSPEDTVLFDLVGREHGVARLR